MEAMNLLNAAALIAERNYCAASLDAMTANNPGKPMPPRGTAQFGRYAP